MQIVANILCICMLSMIGLSANGHLDFFSKDEAIHQCCSASSCSPDSPDENKSEEKEGLCNPLDGCPNCMVFLKSQLLSPLQDKMQMIAQDWIYTIEQPEEYYTSVDPPPKR